MTNSFAADIDIDQLLPDRFNPRLRRPQADTVRSFSAAFSSSEKAPLKRSTATYTRALGTNPHGIKERSKNRTPSIPAPASNRLSQLREGVTAQILRWTYT